MYDNITAYIKFKPGNPPKRIHNDVFSNRSDPDQKAQDYMNEPSDEGLLFLKM